MQDFRRLDAWNHAMALAEGVFAATRTFPESQRYGLSSQMQRSATSIASNIAEGCGRESKKDFARFLRTAYASACELETQARLAVRIGVGDPDDLQSIVRDSERARRILTGLRRSVLARRA